VLFSEPFSLSGDKNLRIHAGAPKLANSWIYVECDLYNADTGAVYGFDLPIEFYFGSEGGEWWSEGSKSASRYLSAPPAGSYVLRVSVERDRKRWGEPDTVAVHIVEGVFRWRYWLALLIALSVIPVGVILYHRSFEKRRWSQSDFAPDEE
jgi:hypothetical protein